MAIPSEITVVTVNYYSSRLVKRLIVNLRSLATWPEQLRFVVVDNTCGADPERQLIENENCLLLPGVPEVRQGKKLSPEQSQADALNLALSAVKTPYALAVDADVHVFRRGWDEVLLNEIEQDVNCVAIGVPSPRWRIGGYRNFPAPAFCLFRVDSFRALTVNWTMGTERGLACHLNKLRSKIMMLGPLVTRERYELSPWWRRRFDRWAALFPETGVPEVGQRMAMQVKKMHLRTVLFDHVLYTELDPKNTHPVLVELARNFELYNFHGKPFLTHRGGGRHWRWRKERTNDTVYWLECIRFVESSESE